MIFASNYLFSNMLKQCWKFPKKFIRHQGWQLLKVVSPDEKLPALVPHMKNSWGAV
jgi:hypothetical protein